MKKANTKDPVHHLDVTTPDGKRLGRIYVHTFAKNPAVKGINARFVSEYPKKNPSLKRAAKKLGAHHFNWYQVGIESIGAATKKWWDRDACGHHIGVPYVDPPCGGYAPNEPGGLGGWADKLPWYFDETKPPKRYGTTAGMWNHQISADKKITTFIDEPAFHSDSILVFNTWLVSVQKDGSMNAFHGGFSWESISFSADSGTTRLRGLLFRNPTEAEYDDLVLRGDMSYCWFWLSD